MPSDESVIKHEWQPYPRPVSYYVKPTELSSEVGDKPERFQDILKREVGKEKNKSQWMEEAIDKYVEHESNQELIRKIYSKADQILNKLDVMNREDIEDGVNNIKMIVSKLFQRELGME